MSKLGPIHALKSILDPTRRSKYHVYTQLNQRLIYAIINLQIIPKHAEKPKTSPSRKPPVFRDPQGGIPGNLVRTGVAELPGTSTDPRANAQCSPPAEST